MGDDFYLSLISNSSFDHFPDNKTSKFRVHLNKEINLDSGHWTIALSEIIFPNNFLNVTEGSNKISVKIYEKENFLQQPKTPLKTFVIQISPAHYSTLDELIDEINIRSNKQIHCDLFESKLASRNRSVLSQGCAINILNNYVDRKGRVVSEEPESDEDAKAYKENVVVKSEQIPFIVKPFIGDLEVEVALEGKLALQLGHIPDSNILNHILSPHPAGLEHGLPRELFVYIDCVEPQIISNSAAQVLKILKATERGYAYGEIISREIQNRNYITVNKKRFQTISVELRDAYGLLLPFSCGQTILLTHFKRAEPSLR